MTRVLLVALLLGAIFTFLWVGAEAIQHDPTMPPSTVTTR